MDILNETPHDKLSLTLQCTNLTVEFIIIHSSLIKIPTHLFKGGLRKDFHFIIWNSRPQIQIFAQDYPQVQYKRVAKCVREDFT